MTGVNGQTTLLAITPVQQFALALGGCALVNGGVAGSHSGDWLMGSANFNNLLNQANATAAANACSQKFALIMIGANDAIAGIAPSVYQSNLLNQINGWLSLGFKVTLNYCTYASLPNQQLLQQYNAEINNTVNGQNIRHGDVMAWRYFSTHRTELAADLLHPTQDGAIALGWMWASSFWRTWLSNGA